jgi:hypothetical protein
MIAVVIGGEGQTAQRNEGVAIPVGEPRVAHAVSALDRT